MAEQGMQLSDKQNEIGRQIKAGKKVILLEGAMGTSKTYGAAVAMITIAMEYPGSILFTGRMSMPEMRTGTLLSFREAASDMGLVEGKHYKDNKSDFHFQFLRKGYGKGSFIFFREMNHTKDPQFFKLKSANITAAFIDEADGVVQAGFNMLSARTGRANKNGAPDFVLMACNANEGWLKELYYDKFKDPVKNGALPSDVAVIEFELEDSFLPDSYYLKQMRNPKQWIERYLKNNWSFGDDLYSLFKYRHMDAIKSEAKGDGTKTMGLDVGRVHDRTTGGVWTGDVLSDIQIFKAKGVEMDYDDQAEAIYEYCMREGIGYQNIWIDGVGEGQGLRTALKTLYGWDVSVWISNSTPESKRKLDEELRKAVDDFQKVQVKKRYPVTYLDLRSEQAYLMSVDIEQAGVKFYEACPHLAEFKKEATMHNHDNNGRVFKLEPKAKVKERTQLSPDLFDCVLMGYYGRSKAKQVGSYSSRRAATTSQPRKGKSRFGRTGLSRRQSF